ncbi:hypothetical protein [Sphingomonas sp. MM-1]|uniref:hypothetical protein n=1 Tax=Sphingomonas sp. MM-1 TaxID=745310 RepID=UPI001181ECB4|nr:hypothetical protein [Sphingomonas sp. MM-1]
MFYADRQSVTILPQRLQHPRRFPVELARMAPEKVEAFSKANAVIAAAQVSTQADMLAQARRFGPVALKGDRQPPPNGAG